MNTCNWFSSVHSNFYHFCACIWWRKQNQLSESCTFHRTNSEIIATWYMDAFMALSRLVLLKRVWEILVTISRDGTGRHDLGIFMVFLEPSRQMLWLSLVAATARCKSVCEFSVFLFVGFSAFSSVGIRCFCRLEFTWQCVFRPLSTKVML